MTVNKQHNRYIGTQKNAKIIRVVNGLAFSMVTVFEDIFLLKYEAQSPHLFSSILHAASTELTGNAVSWLYMNLPLDSGAL